MHYPILDLAETAFILACFVIPSLFSNGSGSVTVPDASHIPWATVIVYLALVVYMAVRYHTTRKDEIQKVPEYKNPERSGFSRFLSFITHAMVNISVTYIYLRVVNYIISKLAIRFGGSSPLPDISVSASSTKDVAFLVFWTILLASFEEFIYRWLLPTRFRSLMLYGRQDDAYTTTRKVLCEMAVICLFALSHRYMGWWAVANAFFAGIILRMRYFMSGSVYPALIAHILYNLTAFYGILKP